MYVLICLLCVRSLVVWIANDEKRIKWLHYCQQSDRGLVLSCQIWQHNIYNIILLS